MIQTIKCIYSCKACGLKKVAVPVPVREQGQDLMVWMNTLMMSLGGDHFKRSPHCKTTSLDEVMIPITGANQVGGPAVN